ncbi:hypothetical protein E4U32_008125 [Claviceps aff. humidiphila group G2b]|nr:hypothetical protein E4U32_008125 [Claviceps aff. humidiphila group G2b]
MVTPERDHPLSGIGSVNVETVSPEAIAERKRVPKHLRADFDIIARLVQPSALEGNRVHRSDGPIHGAPREDLDQSVEKVIQKALPTSSPIWASITARGVPGPLGPHNPPPMAVPSRLHREVLIKGTFINSNVSGRSPGEIVKAVNAATKTDTAVAARRLASGDTVVTCRDSTSRPNADDTEWKPQSTAGSSA